MKELRNFKGKNIDDELLQAKKKYGDMDEDTLVSELKRQVTTSRQNGTYSPEQMLSYISYLSPYLTPEQKLKLESILEQVDE